MSKKVMHFKTIQLLKPLMILLIFVTGFLITGCGSNGEEENLERASYDLNLENSKGERLSMEEFKGKVIFMNVWATWCPPCIEEMPTIHNLYEEVGDEDIVFLMLSMDQDFEKAIQYREKYGYNFEIYRPVSALPAVYYTKLIPTTYVINSEGYVVLQHDGVGKFDSAEFKAFLAGVK